MKLQYEAVVNLLGNSFAGDTAMETINNANPLASLMGGSNTSAKRFDRAAIAALKNVKNIK
jgi:hypothetical protein